jgi:hypothetical protein
VSGFSAHESSGSHAPSTNSILGSITDQLFADPSPRGLRRPFGLCLPGAPFREDNDHLPRSGRLAFSVARLCASFGLAASPRTQRQDASNPFLQPTFRATSTHDEHHLWRPPAERRGKPADVRHRDRLWSADALGAADPRTTPDHLAVIRPPAAPRLTARRWLRADRLPRSCSLARGGVEAPQLCRLAAASPSRTL